MTQRSCIKQTLIALSPGPILKIHNESDIRLPSTVSVGAEGREEEEEMII